MIFTGEICRYCARPITVDEKTPQVARCRKCGAPNHTQCWFAANEKCVVPGCDGKASDIAAPKIQDPVGEICPFLPQEPPRREGGEPTPARCVRVKCMLYDAVEKRCALGEIAYTLATVRDAGRQTRHLIHQAVGSSSKQSVHILTTLANSMRSAEKELKNLSAPRAQQTQNLQTISGLLEEIKGGILSLSSDQHAAAEGFDRLAGAVEASGVGERVRARREARLAARAAMRDGRPGAAVGPGGQAEKRGADEAVANDLAAAYVQANRSKDAESVLERVLRDNPDFTTSRITLASLKLRGNDSRGAEQLLQDAPEEANPQLRSELAYARACVAYAVGRSEDAVDLLNEALDEDPWHAHAMAALSDLRARRVGDPVPVAADIALEAAGMKAARLKQQPSPEGGEEQADG